jgi:hypothetical protein
MTQPVPEPLRTMVMPDRDYSLTYALGARANRSRKRIEWTTRLELAAVIIILLGILCL